MKQHRNSLTLGGFAGIGGGGLGELQMVYATELKIEERREDIRRRVELMKIEKD